MTGGVRMVEEASGIAMSCPEPNQNSQRATCEYSDNSNENSIRNEILYDLEHVENAMHIETSKDSTGEDNSGEYQISEPLITDDSGELNPNYQSRKEQSQGSVLIQVDEGTQSEYFTAESQPSRESSLELRSLPSDEGNQSDAYYTADSQLTTCQEMLAVQSNEVVNETHSIQSAEGSQSEVLSQSESKPSTELSHETCSDISYESNETEIESNIPGGRGTETQSVQFDENCEVQLNPCTDMELQIAPTEEYLRDQRNNKTLEETQSLTQTEPQAKLSEDSQSVQFNEICEGDTPDNTQPQTEKGPESDDTQLQTLSGLQTEIRLETQDNNCNMDTTDMTQAQRGSGPPTDLSQETKDDNCEIAMSNETQPQSEAGPQIELSQKSEDDDCEVNTTDETQLQTEYCLQTEFNPESRNKNCGIGTIDATQAQSEPETHAELSPKTQDDNVKIETSNETQPQCEAVPQIELIQKTKDGDCEVNTTDEIQIQTKSELQIEMRPGNCETDTKDKLHPRTESVSQTNLSQETQDGSEIETSNETEPQSGAGPQIELSQKTQDDNCELDTADETQLQFESGLETEESPETDDTQLQTEPGLHTDIRPETQYDNCEADTADKLHPQTETESPTDLCRETQDDNNKIETSIETQPQSEAELQIVLNQKFRYDDCELDTADEKKLQSGAVPQIELSPETQDETYGMDTTDVIQLQTEAQYDKCDKGATHFTQAQSGSEPQTDLSQETQDDKSEIEVSNETHPQTDPQTEKLTKLRQMTQSLQFHEERSEESSSQSSTDTDETQQEINTTVADQVECQDRDMEEIMKILQEMNRQNTQETLPSPGGPGPGGLDPTEASQEKIPGQCEQAVVVDSHSASGEVQPSRSAESNERGPISIEEAQTKEISSQSLIDVEKTGSENSATETDQDRKIVVEKHERDIAKPVETLQEIQREYNQKILQSPYSLAPRDSSQDRQPGLSERVDAVEGPSANGELQSATSVKSNENGSSSNEGARTEDSNSQSNTNGEGTLLETGAIETDQDSQVEVRDGETAETVESEDNQYEGDNSSDSSDAWEPKGDDIISVGNSDSGAEVEDDTSQESETKINSSELYITIKGNPPNVENGDSASPEGFEILEIFREKEETNPKYQSEPVKPIEDPNLDEPFILRRSSRAIKRKRYYEDLDVGDDDSDIDDDDSDIDDIRMTEPYKRKAKTFVVKDTKTLIEMAAKQAKSNKESYRKEPTVVIIDQKLSSGKSSAVQPPHHRYPAGMSTLAAHSLCQNIMARGTTITAITSKINASTQSPSPHPLILPTLKDDMFVLEAPSFIVPYVYEKPSLKPFRQFVDVLGNELAEQKIKEDKMKQDIRSRQESLNRKNEVKNSEEYSEEKESYSIDTEQREMIKKNKEVEDNLDQNYPKELEKRVNRKRRNSDDNISWDGESASDTENEVCSDDETKTVVVTEKNNTAPDVRDVTNLSIEKIVTRKTDNYFHSSLGKFFMNIGLSLAQEHVQSDLLNLKNRKLNKEKKLGLDTKPTEYSIMALKKNLEFSKQNNAPFHFPLNRCEKCNFKTESSITLCHHMEAPHFKDGFYKCNMCVFQTRNAHDILYHTEAEHNVRSRLERLGSCHQCPNCPFEDNGKSKLARHSTACIKKFKPSLNCAPTSDWEPPAKIAKEMGPSRSHLVGLSHNPFYTGQGGRDGFHCGQRVSNAYRNGQEGSAEAFRNLVGRNISHNGLGGSTALYRSQEGTKAFHSLGGPTVSHTRQEANIAASSSQKGSNAFPSGQGNISAFHRSHGDINIRPVIPSAYRSRCSKPLVVDRVMKGTTHYATMKTSAVVRGITIRHCNSNTIINFPVNECGDNPKPKKFNIPEVTITPLPLPPHPRPPVKNHLSNVSGIVCEICDEHMHDRQHLLDHMQWIHKVKIAPRMINFKPPLACKKCPLRFRTDQGLERHLLGAHGLVTNSIQDAANKGLDGGRCPVCGKVYQRMLLNHVEREHRMKLKPASLSYKCNVCTATFTMYKYFENHIFSVHSNMTKNNAGMPRSDEERDLDVVEISDAGTAIPRPRRVPVITSAKAFNTASAPASASANDNSHLN